MTRKRDDIDDIVNIMLSSTLIRYNRQLRMVANESLLSLIKDINCANGVISLLDELKVNFAACQSRTALIRRVNMQILKYSSQNFTKALEASLYHLFGVYSGSIDGSTKISRKKIDQYASMMREQDWDNVFTNSYRNVLIDIVDKKVKEISDDDMCSPILSQIRQWITDVLMEFISLLYSSGKAKSFHSELCNDIIHMKLCKYRSSKLFEIIADYPDSLEILIELRDSAMRVNYLGQIGQYFRESICRRLLLVGASTSQILDMYILVIQGLRVIDSSDMLLNFVARPVRQYLSNRKDTVRRIVSSLTDSQDSNILHHDLKKGGLLAYGEDEDDEDGGPGNGWCPRQRNPLLTDYSRSKGSDVLTALVSIYGSTDIFVHEYRTLLSEKLLTQRGYSIDSEITTVELLKRRFGEESLHSCEVMLFDMKESKRLDSTIHSQYTTMNTKEPFQTNYFILSNYYWPSLEVRPFTLHNKLAKSIECYHKVYADIKKPRKMHPVYHLGLVDIELEFDDGCVKSFCVSPIQASLITHFSDQSKFSCSALSELCQTDESVVQEMIDYWIQRGIVRQTSHTIVDEYHMETTCIFYELIEEQMDNNMEE